MRAVRFEEYGDESVLQVQEVDDPQPGEGQVVVRVVAASINPGEAGIRAGAMHDRFPARFPEGQGSDLAGVVLAVGEGVTHVEVDEPVIGLSDGRNAQAELVLLPGDRVVRKPAELDWAPASTLYVAGVTALGMLQSVPVEAGDTAVIAGAAGGVGVFLTQLAVGTGARVIAVAGEDNHEWLRAHGAEPLVYGDGLEDRIRALAPDGVTALFDCYGGGYTDLGVALGLDPQRIVTIIDFGAVKRLGVQAKGMAAVKDPVAGVEQLASIAFQGGFEIPIKARYPLDRVQDAYRDLATRHGLGKIVLDVTEP